MMNTLKQNRISSYISVMGENHITDFSKERTLENLLLEINNF